MTVMNPSEIWASRSPLVLLLLIWSSLVPIFDIILVCQIWHFKLDYILITIHNPHPPNTPIYHHGGVPNCGKTVFNGRGTVPLRWCGNENALYSVSKNVFPQFGTPPPSYTQYAINKNNSLGSKLLKSSTLTHLAFKYCDSHLDFLATLLEIFWFNNDNSDIKLKLIIKIKPSNTVVIMGFWRPFLNSLLA